jgi:hypothetical protein
MVLTANTGLALKDFWEEGLREGILPKGEA